MKGILLGITHIALFLLFYLLDLLPESRFFLAGGHIIVFLMITIGVAKNYFKDEYSSFLKAFTHFIVYLSISSVVSIGFDYTFNNYIDTGYKYILAEQRVEQINNRRERKGVGAYETLDSEKIEKKASLEAYGQNLLTSSILNLVVAFAITGVGLLYRKANE